MLKTQPAACTYYTNSRIKKNLDDNYFIRDVLMDLLKAVNCITYDPVIAYGFDKNMLCYNYSYLKS